MRRLAALTALGLGLASLPASIAASQDSGDQGATIRILNVDGVPVDVWLGTEKAAGKLVVSAGVDFEADPGHYTIRACIAGSTTNACAGSAPVGSPASVNVDAGQHKTAAINGNTWMVGTDDLSATPHGKARFTLHNPNTGVTETACIDGDVVTSAGPLLTGDAEVDAGDDQTVKYFAEKAVSDCSGTPAATETVDLAAGTNYVSTFAPSVSPPCTDACVQVLPVGEEGGTATPSGATDFCGVVPQLQTIQTLLQGLFVGIKAGNESTYPGADKVDATVRQIQGILDIGDATVPSDLADAWKGETQSARDILAALDKADQSIAKLPEDQLASIVKSISDPAEPSSAARSREADLLDWFQSSCVLETPEIRFTG
jgi:hypothetical protein